MRTVFILVTRGLIARNILRTDVFPTLRDRGDTRIILLVPRALPEDFRNEFAAPNVLFEEIGTRHRRGLRRRWNNRFLQNLVYTETSRTLARYGTAASDAYLPLPLALFEDAVFSVLSRIPFLKRAARWTEYRFFPDRDYDALFEKYRPDLVVATSMLQQEDASLLKGARRHGVRSVGFSRGWDSVDKRLYRIVPDRMVGWNTYMRDALIRYQEVPAVHIVISGFPQFDVYADASVMRPRGDWLGGLGLPSDRAVVFFGSEGVWSPTDEETLDFLIQAEREGKLARPCSFFIRPHFTDVMARRFERYRGLPGVYVDSHYRESAWFLDHWDPDRADMEWLANAIRHCDAMVTTGSTLLLDAIACDRPAITIAYDPEKGPPGVVSRLYDMRHLRKLLACGGVAVSRSHEELLAQINQALTRPEALAAGRARVREEFCGPVDGRAGVRAGEAVLGWLDERYAGTEKR